MPKGGLGKGLGDLGRQADPFSSGAFNSVGTVFRPRGDDLLVIDGVEYRFVPDLIFGDKASARAGDHGTVYKVTDGINAYALKVFRPEHRAAAAGSLAVHSLALLMPGLSACQRTLLESPRHDFLLRQCPELRWSALLPWVEGPTWGDILRERRPVTALESLTLAGGLARVLSRLEEHGMAHGHLSADNIILPLLACPKPEKPGEPLELVDLEHLCLPGQVRLEILTDWAPCYAHRTSRVPAENALSDRFAGALILAEMLGWYDFGVREAAYGAGGYFDPSELQADCRRFDILQSALARRWGGSVAAAFKRAWRSRNLLDCPAMGEWLVILPTTGAFELGRALERTGISRQGCLNVPAFAGSWLTHVAVVVVTIGIISLPIAIWSSPLSSRDSEAGNRSVLSQTLPPGSLPAFGDFRKGGPSAAASNQVPPALSPPVNPKPAALKTGTASRDLAKMARGGGRTVIMGLAPNIPDGGRDIDVTYAVGGRVVDELGRGIVGVTFMASAGHFAVISDESGSWRMAGLRGTVSLVPTKEGWVFTPVVTRVSGPAELTIVGRARAVQQADISSSGETNMDIGPKHTAAISETMGEVPFPQEPVPTQSELAEATVRDSHEQKASTRVSEHS